MLCAFSEGLENQVKNSNSAISAFPGWLLILLIVSEFALLASAYLAIGRTSRDLEVVENEIAGIHYIDPLIQALVWQGQYRGACTADRLLRQADQALAEICASRTELLKDFYSDPALAEKTGLPNTVAKAHSEHFSRISVDNRSPSAFFNEMTDFNKSTLHKIFKIYSSSQLKLDAEETTYSLARQFSRTLPQVIEQIGILRGKVSLLYTGFEKASSLQAEIGRLEQLLDQYQNNVQWIQQANDLDQITEIKSALMEYSAEIEQNYVMLGDPAFNFSTKVSGLFELGTAVISNVVDTNQLVRARLLGELTVRQADLQNTFWLQAALFGLLLQPALLLLARAINRSLKQVESRRANAELLSIHLEHTLLKQKQMFAIVAHELRTPAAAIDMLVKEDDPTTDDKQMMRETSTHLLHVIDDLRQAINPSESQTLKPETFYLSSLVYEIERQAQPLLAEKRMLLQVTYEPHAEYKYFADLYRLRTIITNLVRNAYVHSEGDKVSFVVSVKPLNEHQHQVAFTVEDNGKGIPPELVDRMFEPFERGNAVMNGTGVGLHIVKTWVDMLSGNIHYSEGVLGGAKFTVTVNLQVDHSVSREDEASAERGLIWLKGKTALLVEDDALIRQIQRKLLAQDAGMRVVLAGDGVEALMSMNQNPDIVITDYFMPNMSGLDLTRKLREQNYQGLIFVVTAATIGTEREELMAAGASLVLSKPLKLNELGTYIANQIDQGLI